MLRIKNKHLTLLQYLVAALLIAMLVLQSCSKSNSKPDSGNTGIPGETATLKYVPDSMFREYLKKNVCPNAFDKSGKMIDITNSEVKNFTGTMSIDTVNCPAPYVSSLKGIEYFSKMTKLIVRNSPIDSLSLTKSMAIDSIKLINRDLQYVNVSGLTSMRYFQAIYLPTTSLDLSNLSALEYISLQSMGRLNELKTDNDANLQHIITYGLTGISSVNVSTNPALRRLFLEQASSLNTLDVTNNRKLRMLIASSCALLKSIDLSKNDSLRSASFDDSGIDSVDFSHNPELFSATLMRTPVRNLNFLSNPKLNILYLDGCAVLKTVDLRAQTSFDFYLLNSSLYNGMSDDAVWQKYEDCLASPVPTSIYSVPAKATRKGVNGATADIFGGLRLPMFQDAGAISLTNVKINDAVKDNYSLVMCRRVLANMPIALITVYAADKSTILCNDYDPLNFRCN
jgi:hypothetical protein